MVRRRAHLGDGRDPGHGGGGDVAGRHRGGHRRGAAHLLDPLRRPGHAPASGSTGSSTGWPCRPSAAPISSPCTSRRWTAPATAPAPRPRPSPRRWSGSTPTLDGCSTASTRCPTAPAVSVVLVSDHGMAEARPDAVIDLDAVADLRGVRAVVSLSGANLVRPGRRGARAGGCATTSTTGPAGVTSSRACAPTCAARCPPRCTTAPIRGSAMWWSSPTRGSRSTWGRRRRPACTGGTPVIRTCTASSLASGPDIRPGQRIGSVDSVDLYPFLARLLRLAPNPDVDGGLAALAPVLAPAAR